MKRIISIMSFVFCIEILYAQAIIIMPISTTNVDEAIVKRVYSKMSSEVLGNGLKLIDQSNIESVLKAYEYNLSGLVYDKEGNSKLGSLLSAKYILFTSLVWNGEYLLFDIHMTEVGTGSIVFVKNYLTNKSIDIILNDGIPVIISELFGVKKDSSVFFDSNSYFEDSELIKIKNWLRQNGISNIFLVYGTMSGEDKVLFERSQSLYSNKKELYQLLKSIETKVLDEKKLIEKSGEYVKVIYLGSFWSSLSHRYYADSPEIDYPLVQLIMNSPSVGIIFYGTEVESATIESFLTREQRKKYWHRWIWK